MKKFTSLMLGVLMTMGMFAQDEVQNDLAQYASGNLYVVGNGCAAGWSPENALRMKKEDNGTFTKVLKLWGKDSQGSDEQGTPRFKFIVARDWHPSITCDINTESQQHHEVVLGEETALFLKPGENDGKDNAFQVAESGNYKITINLTTAKMTIVTTTEEPQPEEPDEPVEVEDKSKLFIIGSAPWEDSQWNYENGIAFEQVEGQNGVLILTTQLYVGEFKFTNDTQNMWEKNVVAAIEGQTIADGSIYDLLYRPKNSGPDAKFLVGEAATYTLLVDLNAMTMTVTKEEIQEPGAGVQTAPEDVVDVLATANTITLSAKGDNMIESATLYDVAGKRVNVVSEAGAHIVLGEGLNSGLYIVKLTCAGEDYVQKIIVK